MLLVDGLVPEHHHKHLGVAQTVTLGQVGLNFLLQLDHIGLILKLKPSWLLNAHAKHFLSLNEAFIDVVGRGEVASELAIGSRWALIDHDPIVLGQIDRLLDR